MDLGSNTEDAFVYQRNAWALRSRAAWLRRKQRRLTARATELNTQLHDLKQQDFDMRNEPAKASGALDRWTDKT